MLSSPRAVGLISHYASKVAGGARSKTTSGAGPGRNIGPGPDVAEGEPRYGLGEVRVPAAPVVDNTWALGAEASCDLAGADEVVCIHHASHDPPG
jgi:hypothetical protein